MSGRYATIVADPPWALRFGGKRRGRNLRQLPYGTKTLDEIVALPVELLAEDDAHLYYLWATHSTLPSAFAVVESWGFRYHCLLTWVKPTGFTPYSWMFNTEFVLFARRGSLPLLRMGRKQDFRGPVQRHSAKPDSFLDLVEEVSPGPYVELFARRQRLGWDTWGDEALEHVSLASTTATPSPPSPRFVTGEVFRPDWPPEGSCSGVSG